MIRQLTMCAAASAMIAGCADRYYAEGPPPPGYGPGPAPVVGPGPGYHRASYDGCSDNAALGTVLGGVAGGVIGSQFGSGGGRAAATVGGVILGGIAGNAIARDACRNDRYDAYYYNRTYYDAFDRPNYGHRYDWRNPHSGHYGYVTPIRVVRGDRWGYRDDCREFRQTVFIRGERYEDVRVACRDRNGWRIVVEG